MSNRRFLQAGDRIHVLERSLNAREGISRKDDTLPPRMLREGQGDDPRCRPVPLEPMLDRYYRIRGYNSNGVPSARTLAKLGLAPRGASAGRVNGLSCREVRPRTRRLRRWYLAAMLRFVGRAIQAVSRVDAEARGEVARLPEGFTFSLGVAPSGPCLVVAKDPRGRLAYLGSDPGGRKIDLQQNFKHPAAALLLFTFRESTAAAVARDRMSGSGELLHAATMGRILDIVNVYLLPRFLARRALKRYPAWPPGRRIFGRMRVYWRTLMGY
jgi:hypothetical protein